MGTVLEFKSKTTELQGPLTAFYFSRKTRAERIAATLEKILIDAGLLYEVQTDNGSYLQFSETADVDLKSIGAALEPYALKDFAVRFGHLEDGHAKP